jgi:hypothetical protein
MNAKAKHRTEGRSGVQFPPEAYEVVMELVDMQSMWCVSDDGGKWVPVEGKVHSIVRVRIPSTSFFNFFIFYLT